METVQAIEIRLEEKLQRQEPYSDFTLIETAQIPLEYSGEPAAIILDIEGADTIELVAKPDHDEVVALQTVSHPIYLDFATNTL